MENRKTVYFRADSNKIIASGHIMRCLPIAIKFRQNGYDVCFVTADNQSDDLLYGFEHIILHSDWENLGTELPLMEELLSKSETKPILFIDTYSITAEYTITLAKYATIVYLGSKRGNLGHLDFQINYCAKTEQEYYTSLYGKQTKCLLGLKYTPLREEFNNIQLHINAKIKRVLLTTGNTDPNGYLPKILESILQEHYSQELFFDVVVGRMFSHIDKLEVLSRTNKNIVLHRDVKRMSDLMKNADLAITAAGNTILELAAAKVPQIAFSMVDEQIHSAKEFQELGMIEYAGEMYLNKDASIRNICEYMKSYIFSLERRKKLIERAAAYVDGGGCERIVTALTEF